MKISLIERDVQRMKKIKRRKLLKIQRNIFHSKRWKKLRYKILVRDNSTCKCCGKSARDGYVMNVDHIKPFKVYPHLALDENNLQTLCSSCNQGKGNWDETDWTKKETATT